MPGNEVGDRVHSFFGQENLSQSQRHPQLIDGSWPGLSNNLWGVGQRQIGGPFISSLKNCNLQQQDQESGHGSQSSPMHHGLNFVKSNLKPEFGRVQARNQQPGLNGYLLGNQVLQGRQNETNFLGIDADANRVNLVARGLSTPQQGHDPDHSKRNSMRLDASESPVGFDFFGGQQPMNSQYLNAQQNMAIQKPGSSDMQLVQRQLMLHQLHEFQRQQQLQQIEPRQQSFMNQVSSVAKQSGGNHSQSSIYGVPVNESSNSLWQQELVPGGANWLQRGASPGMQGPPVGHMLSAEQGQALRRMDMIAQQSEQSLYGVPISNVCGSYSHIQMDVAPIQPVPANCNSFLGITYAPFPDQVSIQEEARPDCHGNSIFGDATDQGLRGSFNLESLQLVNQISPFQEFHRRQEVAESSEKSFNQVTPSQSVAALDPTEEKILFGSDDNFWEAMGKSSNIGMDGFDVLDNSDVSGVSSSLQSGSWSALMQSAVAETCNGESGLQEEWCGPTTDDQKLFSVDHIENPLEVWSTISPSSCQSSISSDANRPNLGINSFIASQFQPSMSETSQVQGELLQTDSSQRFTPKFLEHGSISHPMGIEINANSNMGYWTLQENISAHCRPNNWSSINSGIVDCINNFRTPENRNTLQRVLGGDHKRGMHDELGEVADMWRTGSNAELEHVKPSPESPFVGRNASALNSIAEADSSRMRLNQEVQQQLANENSPKPQLTVYSSTHFTHEAGEKGQMHLAARASSVPFTSCEPSQGQNSAGSVADIGNKASYATVQGCNSTGFSQGFLCARNIENQQMCVAGGEIMSVPVPCNSMSSGSMQVDDSSDRVQASQLVPSYNLVASTEACQIKKMLPNSWTNVPCEQSSLKDASSLFKPSNNLVMAVSAPAKLNVQDIVEGRNDLPSTRVISPNSQSLNKHRGSYQHQVSADMVETSHATIPVLQGSESVVNNFSQESCLTHTATQRKLESIGRSLRPNNSMEQNNSLLHHVAMKGAKIDSDDRTTKRLKVSDQSSYGYNTSVRDSSATLTSIPSGKVLCSLSKPGDASNTSSQDAFAHNSSNVPSNRSEHPQISPLMAPSWFDQYGTFRNGKMLQVFDMQRASAKKPVEQPLIVGNVADDLHAGHSSELSNITADGTTLGQVQEVSAPSDHLSSSQLVPQPNYESLVVERPKKRKTATSELVPWHMELVNPSQRLQTISMAEVDWAKATNRLPEKLMEEESKMVLGTVPVLRPRRRLVLTTQLMQQLLRPLPVALLSSDNDSQYETAGYFSARLALGDACSETGCSISENENSSPKTIKSLKEVDQRFSKVVEDFIGRGKRLESELLRLDKRASILDLRVECQDLEKFSIINRFANFHGRGQGDGSDNSLFRVPRKCITAVHFQCLEIHQTWYNVFRFDD